MLERRINFVKFKDVKDWKSIIDLLYPFVENMIVGFEPDGIYIRQTDPSKVALVDVVCRSDAFDEYHCDIPGAICFPSHDMGRIMQKAKSPDELQIYIDGYRTKLWVELTHITREHGIERRHEVKKYAVPLMRVESTARPPLLRFSSNAQVKVVSHQLYNAVEEVINGVDTEVIEFRVDREGMTVKGSDGEHCVKVSFPVYSFEVEPREPQEAHYDITYVRQLLQATHKYLDLIVLEMSNDSPLKLEFLRPYSKATVYIMPSKR